MITIFHERIRLKPDPLTDSFTGNECRSAGITSVPIYLNKPGWFVIVLNK